MIRRTLLVSIVLLVLFAGGCAAWDRVEKGARWVNDNWFGGGGRKPGTGDPPGFVEGSASAAKSASIAGGDQSPGEPGSYGYDFGEEETVVQPPISTYVDTDGHSYEVIDGVIFVSFPNPPEYDPNQGVPVGDVTWLEDQSIQSFLQETGLTLLYDWPALKVILCKLPPGMSVQQAVDTLPALYPDLVDDVSPASSLHQESENR